MSPKPSDNTHWRITTEWLAWLQSRMAELRINQPQLARMVGTSKMSISDILARKVTQTRLLPAINRALGGTPPRQVTTVSAVDELRQRLDAVWDDLSESEQTLLVQMAAALRRTPL